MQSYTRSDNMKHKSDAITAGPTRAGSRSMLRATGLDDTALSSPFIGVANLASDVTPCNVHLGPLTARGQGGHSLRKRHAIRVRHHHRQRRRVNGHGGNEGFAGQPRGHRRLH